MWVGFTCVPLQVINVVSWRVWRHWSREYPPPIIALVPPSRCVQLSLIRRAIYHLRFVGNQIVNLRWPQRLRFPFPSGFFLLGAPRAPKFLPFKTPYWFLEALSKVILRELCFLFVLAQRIYSKSTLHQLQWRQRRAVRVRHQSNASSTTITRCSACGKTMTFTFLSTLFVATLKWVQSSIVDKVHPIGSSPLLPFTLPPTYLKFSRSFCVINY